MWSSQAEQVVSRLIAELPRGQLDPERRAHATRLSALPIGGSMEDDYYLRPNGEVVVVGEDFELREVDTIHTERGLVLRVLVWGSERYPKLRELLPTRPTDAIDCRCRDIPIFAEGKVLCQTCNALGWLPRSDD